MEIPSKLASDKEIALAFPHSVGVRKLLFCLVSINEMSVVCGVESWQLEQPRSRSTFEPKLDYDNFSLWFFKIETILKIMASRQW